MGSNYLLTALLLIAIAIIVYLLRKTKGVVKRDSDAARTNIASGPAMAFQADSASRPGPASEPDPAFPSRPDADKDFEHKLISMLAHNSRGTFVNLISVMDYFQKGQLTDREAKELASEIKSTAENYLGGFESTLKWVKTQLNGFKFQPQEVKATDAINRAIRNNISEIERKKISLNVTGGNEKWIVYADPELLGFVLDNILNNAVKYSYPSSKVECIIGGVHESFGKVRLRIVDHGMGMGLRTREEIFCHEKTIYTGTDGEKGVGIGLLICKEFIEIQRGSIEVDSEAGRGAVFTMYFPGKTDDMVATHDNAMPLNKSMLRDSAYDFKGPGCG